MNSSGKKTAVGCHFLLQGIFPTQESNLGLLHCRRILYSLSHQGSPMYVLQDPEHMLIPPGSPTWWLSARVVYSRLPLRFHRILCVCVHQKTKASVTICIWFLFGLPRLTSRLNFTILFCLMLLSEHCLKWLPAGFRGCLFIIKFRYIYIYTRTYTYIPGVNNGNPLQYSCLGNPMNRGSWQATVCNVVKSQTWLKQLSTHTYIHTYIYVFM